MEMCHYCGKSSNYLVTVADTRYQCLEPALGEYNFVDFVSQNLITVHKNIHGRVEPSKLNQKGERKQFDVVGKTELRRYDQTPFIKAQTRSSRFILAPFLFAARVFIWEAPMPPHPYPMWTTDSSTMETVCTL